MRYDRPVRFRFTGSQEECRKYIPEARKLLGLLTNQDLSLGGLDQSFRRVVLPTGAVIAVHANQTLPIIEIDVRGAQIREEVEQEFQLRMVWKPEGIILTPTSEEYPDGFGLPTRTAKANPDADPPVIAGAILGPMGTEAGVLPQVLLNRFENNKYLDQRGFIQGVDGAVLDTLPNENPRLRRDYSASFNLEGTQVLYWQGIYDPLSCVPEGEDPGTEYWDAEVVSAYYQKPGVYIITGTSAVFIQPQFSDNLFTDNIFEAESEEWFTHRAEEVLYDVDAYEGCFQETNTIRANVGRGPMYRQVRGHASLARMAVDEVVLTGKQFHDSDEFRPGYRRFFARGVEGVGRGYNFENLLIQNAYPINTFEEGVWMADVWRDSPNHYPTQVSTIWDDPDFPGAEHHVWRDDATVDEAIYFGEIDPPLTGVEGCQVFSKQEVWLPCPSQWNELQYGVSGSYGVHQEHGREHSAPNPYVTFRQHTYYLEQYIDDDTFGGVIGTATYVENGELHLRTVVKLVDFALLDSTTGYLTLKVLTRPVKLTQEFDCDWTEEASVTYNNNAGWLPYVDGGVKFHPDGTRFLYSMIKTTTSYNTALNLDATNFNTDTSATVQDRNTLTTHHVEYNEFGTFQFVTTAVANPLVTINCSTTDPGGNDHENIYERAIKAKLPVFQDYDADGNRVYAYCDIDEYTYQRWKNVVSDDPETESHGYRLRKIVFPSGKEVVYTQQYFWDSESMPPDEVISRGFPGNPTDESYVRRIAYLDIVAEDIIYHHINWDTKMVSSSGTDEWLDSIGSLSVEMDLGFGLDRQYQVLYQGPVDTWSVQQNVLLLGDRHVNSSNRSDARHTFPHHVSIEEPNGIYCMDQAPQSWWANVDNSAWIYYRQVHPTPYAHYEDANGVPDDSIIMYQGTTATDSMYGRPPAADYFASVAPGISGFTGADNTYPLWNPAVWGSLQTGNVAPQMADDPETICKVVRYRDRIVVRVNTVRRPYAIPDVTQSDYSGVDAAYKDMPDELNIVLYTNFDLDEAVGMVDVKDIYPMGKV